VFDALFHRNVIERKGLREAKAILYVAGRPACLGILPALARGIPVDARTDIFSIGVVDLLRRVGPQ
jgi:hypothetical protein